MQHGGCLALQPFISSATFAIHSAGAIPDEVSLARHVGIMFFTLIVNLARLCFFISVTRNAFVILILTIGAWLYTRHRKSKSGKYPIKILQTVPAGFKHIGQPVINHDLAAALAPQLPVATIVLFLEHIAISKSKFAFDKQLYTLFGVFTVFS